MFNRFVEFTLDSSSSDDDRRGGLLGCRVTCLVVISDGFSRPASIETTLAQDGSKVN